MASRSVLDFPGDNYVELLFGNKSVLVEVGPADELVDLVVGDVFSEFSGDALEVLGGDEAGPLVVEESEDFVNVGTSVLIVDALGQEGKPLPEVDAAVAVCVQVRDHLVDGVALGLESE